MHAHHEAMTPLCRLKSRQPGAAIGGVKLKKKLEELVI
jgi:hypothetical protein